MIFIVKGQERAKIWIDDDKGLYIEKVKKPDIINGPFINIVVFNFIKGVTLKKNNANSKEGTNGIRILFLFVSLVLFVCTAIGQQISSLSKNTELYSRLTQWESEAPTRVKEQIKILRSGDAPSKASAAVKLREMGPDSKGAILALTQIFTDITHLAQTDQYGNMIMDRQTDPQSEAIKTLAMIGKPAVEALITLLKDGESKIRNSAALTLGEIKDASAVEPIVAAIDKIPADTELRALRKFDKADVIGALTARSKSWDPDVRKKVAGVLGGMKDSRVNEALISLLKDQFWFVRVSAAKALGEIKDTSSVGALANLIADGEHEVRSAAAEAFGEIKGSAAIGLLVTLLADKDGDVRKSAAKSLGEIKDTAVVGPLIMALKDPYSSNLVEIVKALGKTKDRRTLEPLYNSLALAKKSNNEYLKMAVVIALGEIKDSRAIDTIATLLGDYDAGVADSAAKALLEIKDLRAVDALNAALKSKKYKLTEYSIKVLGEIKDTGAVEPLIAELKHDSPVPFKSDAAVKALGEIEDPRAVDPLIFALDDTYEPISTHSAQALGKIKSARAVEPLIAHLRNKDGRISYSVVDALGEIKDQRAVKPLIECLKDATIDPPVEDISKALKSITNKDFGGDYKKWNKWWNNQKNRIK